MVRDRVNFHFRAPARYNVTLVVQLVAFSLLVAQLMGLMHGVVHNPLCKLETPICRLGYAQPNGRDHYYFAGEVSKADAREGKGLRKRFSPRMSATRIAVCSIRLAAAVRRQL